MRQDRKIRKTLILGSGIFAEALINEIRSRRDCGYQIIGVISEKSLQHRYCQGYPVLGSMQQLQQVLREVKPDCIVVSLFQQWAYPSLHNLVEAKFCKNIQVEDGESFYEKLTGKLAMEVLTPGGIISSQNFQPSPFLQGVNRVLSFVFAIIGLAVFAPLLLLIALIIKLDSSGPVFFVQERVGLNGKPFRLIKFRTMKPVNGTRSEWEEDNRHRITRVGHYLRKFRLDELPQFINVLRGDMDLVGPRPHPASNYELFVLVARNTPECGGQIPYYSLRTRVRPGITGWAQVRYRYANNVNEEIEKLRFDLYFVKHYSLWLFIQILFETVKVVVMGNTSQVHGFHQEYSNGTYYSK